MRPKKSVKIETLNLRNPRHCFLENRPPLEFRFAPQNPNPSDPDVPKPPHQPAALLVFPDSLRLQKSTDGILSFAFI